MKVTVVIVIALGINLALRQRSAALRHWVLAAGILCAGLTPLLGMVLPEWHPPLGNRLIVGSPAARNEPLATTEVEFSIPTPPDSSRIPGPSLDRARRMLWIAGTTLSLLVLVAGLSRLAWLASRARRVADPRWQELLGPVLLLQSPHPTLLVTWGFFSPKIVLPASAEKWSDERMRIVLWHELAHIRRGDWFVQMAADFVRAAFWFNPLVWIACRRLRQESEQACDDAVLNCGVQGPDYATELLGLARDLRQPRYSMFSGFPAPAMARPSSLGRRVSAMLNVRINRNPISTTARVATAIALLLAAIPIATAQTFATFSGTLVDSTGGPLPGVPLVLSNTGRQSKYEVKSSPAGTFEFVGLPSGIYTLDAQQNGFATLHESVSIAPGQNLQRRLTLQVGSLQETITVRIPDTDPASDPGPKTPAVTQKMVFQPADLSSCVVSAVGGNIRPPKKLRDVHPEYPAVLRGTGTDGIVVLDATIGLDGFLKNIEVREGANPELAGAAVAAVREWQYSQTILNCTPVEPSIKVTTRFTSQQ
jgi:beta-lactamase regulating signal transducer with metallopeptidase domain